MGLSWYDFVLSANLLILMWRNFLLRWLHVLYWCYSITCWHFFFLSDEGARDWYGFIGQLLSIDLKNC